MQITELERRVLIQIPKSEYIDLPVNDRRLIHHSTWVFPLEDSGVKGKQLSGVISSLSKKGLVSLDSEEGDSLIALTELGFDLIQE